MIELASASAEDRRELFRRAGSDGVGPSDPTMIEKDYWVCWVLDRLFGSLDSDELVPGLVFKGGTSLSKVYGAIHRFSEDIDLTIPRVAAGIEAEADLALGMPRAQVERRLEAMSRRCELVVSSSIRTDLANRISERLAAAARDERWSLEVAAEDASTLIYSYPPALTAGEYGADGYVRPSIRLEFGLKNDP